MYLQLKLKQCLEELKRSPFIISMWKDEILKSARAMEIGMKSSGRNYGEIIIYLVENFTVLSELKKHGYADLLEKPLLDIELAIREYKQKIQKAEAEQSAKQSERELNKRVDQALAKRSGRK